MRNKFYSFLNYCYNNRVKISVITILISFSILSISVLIFNNSYFATNLHWSICLIGASICFFVNFCIKE